MTCETITANLDHKKRFTKQWPGGPSADPYFVELDGVNVPENAASGWCDNGSAYSTDWCTRDVYWAIYWEGTDRADTNGPCSMDGIGDTADPGCP